MEKLPIGLQHFASLREDGYIYVDKTQYIWQLLRGNKYVFLSRPRRFGKSLLLSTIRAIFEGRQDLFAGLWIENQHDFEPKPIIRLEMNGLDDLERPLEVSMLKSFQQTAKDYGLVLESNTAKSAFGELVIEISKISKVVVLVDEYDKPITDHLDNPQKQAEHTALLKSVYGQLKLLDEYLHFVIFTGVSKIGKLSLFSDLNNLRDISFDKRFSAMLGYSREEIERHFTQSLVLACDNMGITLEKLWEGLKYWYNGYSWDGEQRLYCPFSFMIFLEQPEFRGYWYETGTPTLLIKTIEQLKIDPMQLEHVLADVEALSSLDLSSLNLASIMFQTGYLTIEEVRRSIDGTSYLLEYPNNEVRTAFSRSLLDAYTQNKGAFVSSLGSQLAEAMKNLDFDRLFILLRQVYASVPYWITPEQEKHFHAMFHIMMCSSGLPTQSELSTSRGRIDTVVNTRQQVLLFEFKLSGSPAEALAQIDMQGYGAAFDLPVYKIGVVFDRESRNIKEWAVIAPDHKVDQ
jgi:hypothetical protein